MRLREVTAMSEEMIVENCSPTLAGIKTANLFSCHYEEIGGLRREIRNFNRVFAARGLCMIPLRMEGGRALVYLYRPGRLRADLAEAAVRALLERYGYPSGNPNQCVARLIGRLRECRDFPHEIGLFLGYPAEDVRGFIENGAQGCKCAGFWKVYGDEEKARETFAQYRRCMDEYMRCWEQGQGIERLAVAD